MYYLHNYVLHVNNTYNYSKAEMHKKSWKWHVPFFWFFGVDLGETEESVDFRFCGFRVVLSLVEPAKL